MHLKLQLWRLDEWSIAIRVLEQERPHTVGDVVSVNGFRICIRGFPEIWSDALYVRGDHHADDDRIATKTFSTAAECTAWIRGLEACMAELRNPSRLASLDASIPYMVILEA